MNISKRILGVLLSLLLIFSAVTVSLVSVSAASEFPAYDGTKPNLVIGTAEYTGTEETVKVPVSIGNNPGLWGANFQVQFDSENLEYNGIEPKNKDLWANCDATVSGDVLTILLDATNLENDYNNDGELFYLIFTPKSYNAGSTYAVSFKYVDRLSIVNQAGEDLELTYKNGGVKCGEGVPVGPTQPEEPTSSSVTTSTQSPTTAKPTTPIGPTKPSNSSVNSSNTAATTTVNINTAATKAFKVKAVKGKKQIKISYKKVAGAAGFQVRYKIKGKWKVKTFKAKKNATKLIKNLKKGTYKVQLRCYKTSGKTKVFGKWGKTNKVKVK